MGGIEWAGFEQVVDMLGVTDPDRLIERLLIIKAHKAPDPTEST